MLVKKNMLCLKLRYDWNLKNFKRIRSRTLKSNMKISIKSYVLRNINESCISSVVRTIILLFSPRFKFKATGTLT